MRIKLKYNGQEYPIQTLNEFNLKSITEGECPQSLMEQLKYGVSHYEGQLSLIKWGLINGKQTNIEIIMDDDLHTLTDSELKGIRKGICRKSLIKFFQSK